jgi:hypothetical protein
MADSAVVITAGTGTNIDTRTEATSGHHRQVVVLGDPSTNAGVAPVDATTGLAVNMTNTSLTVTVTGAYSASAAFTPAAASHTAGDCNGAAAEFTSMGESAGRIMITSASLLIAGATAEATAWRLYLFDVTPPSAVADDGPFVLPAGDLASFLGYVDLGTAVDLTDNQWVEVHGLNKSVKLAGTSLFAYLVNLTTVTPAAVAHTVTLHAVGL